MIRFKTAEVSFHVQPFKFSEADGEKTYNLSGSPNEIEIRNNGNYFSRPTLKITGSGVVEITLNNNEILTISFEDEDQTIIIDADQMNAIDEETGLLVNRLVIGNYDNIRLNKGSNIIGISGNVTKVKISNYSRWI